ncbi:MAG: hypothetical protein HOV81_42235 [Kofleriaceae bacterium]|nr:hypothetical protein [Kofleriaceae bacterium]
MIALAACGESNHAKPDAGEPPGDTGPVRPKCDDGADNDGDGKVDYPYDPGCIAPNADDEADDCPSGPNCPQCGNGIDDDMNGQMDYPNDPSCTSAADEREYFTNPNACGTGLTIKDMPITGSDTVTLDMSSSSNVTSPCGGGGSTLAYAYELHIPRTTVLVATTDDTATTADTILDLRSSMCSDPGSEIVCHNDLSTTNKRSTITQLVAPGIYYLIVQAANTSVSGSYNLHISYLKPEGTTCVDASECGPGLVCRVPLNQTGMLCTKPMCSDAVDDDGDGKNDFPEDPGCTDASDNDETDDCPNGPNCGECANGIDDDGDTNIDFPDDLTCISASGTTEACPSHEPVAILTMPMTTGDTSMATDDSKPSCASTSSTAHAPDLMYRLDVPATTTLRLNMTASWDTVTALYNSTCGGTAVACSDPLNMTVSNLAAGTYYFLVDGWSTASGPFTINVSGTIANGASCESALAQSGALTCATGYLCTGTMGSRTCTEAACHDSIDSDGDGKPGFPLDPGCTSVNDNDETDDCPSGPNCPQCSNGIDDDASGQTDYPADPNCASASGALERTCPLEQDMFAPITMPSTTDTLVGAHDDHNPSCGGDGGPDRLYTLTIPALKTLRLDTNGSTFDTLLSLMGAACTEPSTQCDDNSGTTAGASSITRSNIAAGTYVVAVDAANTTTVLGNYTLHVSGVLNAGASCEPANTLGGALVCDVLSPCAGTAGSRICTPVACIDGNDNDGDGKTDFPNDPGCDSVLDNDEADACPGPGCPVCSNGADDDTDTKTDFPTDPSCWAASAPDEAFCTAETNRTLLVMTPQTTGTTVGATNDFNPQSCQSNTNNDVTLALVLPVPVASLSIDTNGSALSDTVLSVRDATCGNEIDCDDDGGTSLRSRITLTNVSPGTYSVIVDGYSTNTGEFVLNVSGTVAMGTACTSPLFATGVLACPTGTTCTAGTCQ